MPESVATALNQAGRVNNSFIIGVILITDGIRITHLRIIPQWAILRWKILTFTALVTPCLVFAEDQAHGQVEEEEGLVPEGDLLKLPLGGEGFFRAAMLRAEGFFRAARVGEKGFLKTGQEPGRCLRAIPGPPTQRIAARMDTTVREVIL